MSLCPFFINVLKKTNLSKKILDSHGHHVRSSASCSCRSIDRGDFSLLGHNITKNQNQHHHYLCKDPFGVHLVFRCRRNAALHGPTEALYLFAVCGSIVSAAVGNNQISVLSFFVNHCSKGSGADVQKIRKGSSGKGIFLTAA